MLRQIAGIGVAMCVLGAILGTLQMLWPAQARLRRSWRELRTDLTYWLMLPLVNRPMAQVAAMAAAVPTLWLLGLPLDREALLHGHGPVASWPGWLQVLVVAVIGDFIGYLLHRALHRGRLWPIHAVHHGTRELTWIAAVRVHPLNDALTRMAQALPFVALGFSPMLLGAYLPLLTFHAILLHANLRWDFGPLRYVLASPTFHRWHHADDERARDKNFAGLFPLWDMVFGTLYLPRGERPQSFGVRGEAIPAGWVKQMIHPFRRRTRISAA
jgi:sterol desaturase/sphingolipid hydroxylase (fatty acid hydroxylase superfamily)